MPGLDKGLDYLLDLNGEILIQEDRSWIKIEAKKLSKKTKECPHGIKYSLTLHNSSGNRVLGFDNAHSVKTKKKGRFIARKIVYDHMHEHSTGNIVAYEFQLAEQLLTDFFSEVDKYRAEKR